MNSSGEKKAKKKQERERERDPFTGSRGVVESRWTSGKGRDQTKGQGSRVGHSTDCPRLCAAIKHVGSIPSPSVSGRKR